MENLIIAGKCSPEPDVLAAADDRGFDTVELYLEKQHLETVTEALETVEASNMDVVSVHTPHVPLAEKEYLLKTDELAGALNATIVFHSRYLNHVDTPQLEELDLDATYGYENKTGVSVRHLEHMVLKQGYDLVLDVAHLFMAEADYLGALEYLLTEYDNQIELLHLCDSTPVQDGLRFGAGDMDLRATTEVIERTFDGTVILEVMPADQRAALEAFVRYRSALDAPTTEPVLDR